MRFLAHGILGAVILLVAGCGGESASPNEDTGQTAANKDDDAKDDGAKDDGAEDDATGADDSDGDSGEGDSAGDSGDSDEDGDSETEPGGATDDSDPANDPPASSATGTGTPPTMGPPVTTSPGIPVPVPPSMPGKPPLVPGTPPEGCGEPDSMSRGTGYCSLQVPCTNDYLYASCSMQTDGAWSCGCSSNFTGGNYRLTGVDESNACTTVLEQCKAGQAQEAEFGELTCPAPTITAEPASGYCYADQQCYQEAPLSDGVSAVAYDSRYAQCSDLGNGTLQCYCGSSTYSQNFDLTGTNITAACSTLLDICSTGTPPEFDAEAKCEPSYTSSGAGYCSNEVQCTRSASLTDGVQAVQREYQSSSCSENGSSGTWSCNCSTSSRYVSFEASGDTLPADPCSGAMSLCTTDTAIEPEGEITCQNSSQSLSGDYCYASLSCTQAAEVDGMAIRLYGGLSVTCNPDAEGGFTCACGSDTESASLSVEGESLWDACSNGADLCPTVVTPAIGTSGGGGVIGRPVPIGISAPAGMR